MRRPVAAALLLLSVALPVPALACSCMWTGPFAKVALGQPLVVLAEIRSHDGNGMDVRVLEVVKGTEPRKTIRVWGDNGALCRPYVSAFPAGSRWLLAVSPLPERPADSPRRAWQGFHSPPGDRLYAISICGEFWVEVRGERAFGRITMERHSNARESVPLGALLAWLRSGGTGPALSSTPEAPGP